MKVMVVDDNDTNRKVCRIILSEITHDIIVLEDGSKVIPALQACDDMPDVILLDVLMPIKDGFTAAQEIRTAFPENHIPIIFLTALNDRDSFERCLNLGDDFILKPVDRSVLLSKVRAHSRIAKMHGEITMQRDELRHFHEQVKYDYAIAESIFGNLMDEMSAQIEKVHGLDYLSTPMTVFNGDLIVVASRPHGGVYVMIADATGHGLPAAISAIPATRAFFSMAAKGLALGEIVSEINSVLVRFLPVGMMLAASVFEVRANGFEVSWWGGGLPTGYILGSDGEIVRELVSTHMPLGVLKENEFEASVTHLKLAPSEQLICYTDGVTEATNAKGEQFGSHRIEQAIVGQSNLINSLHSAVNAFSQDQSTDDLSILSMRFPITNGNPSSIVKEEGFLSTIPIQSSLSLDADLIKSGHVMNQVRGFLTGMVSGGVHLDLVCSVISELVTNAIDHGLLDLDSRIKDDPDGFFTFYQVREDKLKELKLDAKVTLDFDYCPNRKLLKLVIEHNGAGFDYQKMNDSKSSDTHGRGIILTRELCESLEYSNEGCKVTATYLLDGRHHFPSSA